MNPNEERQILERMAHPEMPGGPAFSAKETDRIKEAVARAGPFTGKTADEILAAGGDPLRALSDGRTGIKEAMNWNMPWELALDPEAKPVPVMQEWTGYMTLRMQGVLVQALRGPDGSMKESRAKPIIRNLRGVCMVSGRERDAMGMGLFYSDDLFMQTVLIGSPSSLAWDMAVKDFLADVDSYNIHFYQHLAQAWACVGLGHPNEMVRGRAWLLYVAMAEAFHWWPETAFQFMARLSDGKR